MELVVYSCLMHDLGWATTKELLSTDKRFEVDSANLARQFLALEAGKEWDKHRLQLSWDAIALHTTGSIALHKEAEVILVRLGIGGDFLGPNIPPKGLISLEEYREIVDAFPRLDFKEEFLNIMCGLCRDKPDTTMDNFVAGFGCEYGFDGKGTGKEDFQQMFAEKGSPKAILNRLEALAAYE